MKFNIIIRTMDSRRPKNPVLAANNNVPGEVAPKEIIINRPLIGLFENTTCKFTAIKFESFNRFE